MKISLECFLKINYFIIFGLCWVFTVAPGLSLDAVHMLLIEVPSPVAGHGL